MPETVSAGPPASRWEFDAIGTAWSVETPQPLDPAARSRVQGRVDAFDAEWSRFRDDSLVSGLAASGGAIALSTDGQEMLDAYASLSDATDGAVNPLIGGSLERLGYDASYSLRAGEPMPAPADWRERLTWSGGLLALRGPGVIDVGALGKGRLVDIVAGLLPGDGVVDAGGDILARGTTQRVALEHPYDTRRAIGVITIHDEALCASAANRRAWGDGLHHVLDARTGLPVRTIVATWAIAKTAMRADATATALFFDGGPELAAGWGVHWVRMLSDGRLEWSLGSRIDDGSAEVFA
ncbi:FAD:protein FMN transferase [Microbacterium marinilacus]|uniref:FAD:protein FMN transferase n=1 Tax=Microbacterium marinilacus TaxID=415209 RepID=A0ABP7BWC1_9MICO|nr:FAD:protein FMN transferase [Microbacterium marinilacus]MBY0688107.1 FAD:protein FMN transferase [Microbacterium marinilacus]